MDGIRNLVLISCILAVAISLLEMVSPSNRLKKQLRLIFSLIFIIGIVTPIFSGKISFSGINTADLSLKEGYKNVSADIDNELKLQIEENISNRLTEKLEINGYSVKGILTMINILDDKSIVINEVKVSANSIDEQNNIFSLIHEELGENVTVILEE